MKKIIVLFLLSVLLTSCWKQEIETEQKPSKEKPSRETTQIWTTRKNQLTGDISVNDFLIETKSLNDFNNFSYIEKIWQIVSNQSIDLKSQVSWRLSTIYVKEWELVYKWQTLAKITDTYSKYYLDLEKAEIDYDKHFITKESQLLSLDKQINNAKISLDEAKQNYDNAKITAEEDTKKAKLDYGSSNLVDTNSEASLELEKAKLDYDNLLNSNRQTLNTHINNVKKEYNNLVLDLFDVIKFWDELLWVTSLNKNKNDSFENYLWIKDSSQKNKTEDLLKSLISYKETIYSLDTDIIEESSLVWFMDSYYEGYDKIKIFLASLENTLDNSISSVWSLSDSDINSYTSQVNSYQNSNKSNISSFTSTRSSINSFLNTYKNSELSSLKNIELQELKLQNSDESGYISYNKTLVFIDNALKSSQTKYKQAELTYNNAVANKKITTKSLDNSISSSKNSLNKASIEYSKLTIKSPIDWIISSINIDNNTDVSNGSNLFTLVSNNNTKIEISLNISEIENINVWDKAIVEYLWENISWEVYSKSRVADSKLEYNVLVSLDKKIDFNLMIYNS